MAASPQVTAIAQGHQSSRPLPFLLGLRRDRVGFDNNPVFAKWAPHPSEAGPTSQAAALQTRSEMVRYLNVEQSVYNSTIC